jgi:hypothetical protein
MKNILIIFLLLLSFKTFSYEKDTILNHLSDSTGVDYMVKVYQEKNEGSYTFKMLIVNPDMELVLELTPDEYGRYKDVKSAKIDKKYLPPKKVYTEFEKTLGAAIIIIIVIGAIILILIFPQAISEAF